MLKKDNTNLEKSSCIQEMKPAAASVEEEELDLTPTPPRPDEDPHRGRTFLEVMHIPEPKNEQQLLQYGNNTGGMRFSAKH
ncbi:MAG: hypothetical protein AAFV53_36885 [Myxococcota bacterium]